MSLSSTTTRAALGERLADGLVAATPALLYGLRLAAGVAIALYVAFALELDNPGWAGTSAAIVAQPVLGASLRKGVFRLIGTVVGASGAVALTAVFPQNRLGFLFSVALWCAGCSFTSTVLRNFAAYAATLAGYTLVIIAADSIQQPDHVFLLAVSRGTEIVIGILSAMAVQALTRFGDTPERLAGALRDIARTILTELRAELERGGRGEDTRPTRRALLARGVTLSPMQDQAVGESAGIGASRPTLRAGIRGLLLALSAWRTISAHLRSLPDQEAKRLGARLAEALPVVPGLGEITPLTARDRLFAAAAAARAREVATPGERLGYDRIASVADGLGRSLNTIVLLRDVRDALPIDSDPPLLVPDIMPPLLNALRVFLAVGAGTLLVIATAWPGGYTFLIFLSVTVLLLSPQNEAARPAIVNFALGTVLAAVLAAVAKFAVLPNHEGFPAFALILSLFLVPLGALSLNPRLAGLLTPATMNFVPLLGPTNEITFDTVSFANAALAIVGGCAAGAVVLSVIPPVPRHRRTERLLALTLHRLRTLARHPGRARPEAWRRLVYGRLVAMPDTADPIQGTRLLAALTVGLQMMSLREHARRLGAASPAAAEAALARGDVPGTAAALEAMRIDEGPPSPERLRAGAAVREIVETLRTHADFFGAEVR